ncbi:hypothetical protein KUV73_05395 [Mameliella alba]|nr:hypothetical protein [Mameliella alba]MBY6168994.1 hypothetical protein [Mameliella alba]MBY6173785.1 hypothetical protein [Mameliella alba]
MIRLALASVACLAAAPLHASDLVLHEILSEQPLSDAENMKVVISRVTLKPGGTIERMAHPGDMHAVILTGGTVELGDGEQRILDDGTVVFRSAGVAYGPARNIGSDDIEILVTHVVNVLEPFSWPVE